VTGTGGSGGEGRGELRLSLNGNNLLCACDEEEFVRWMKSKDSLCIVDRASLMCARTERFVIVGRKSSIQCLKLTKPYICSTTFPP